MEQISISRWTRGALVTGLACLFLVEIDAQWLLLDDFSLIGLSRSRTLGALLGEILATRSTPHVRFAFLQQILLIPLFRWFYDSRAAVNLVYLALVAMLLGAGYLLCRPLRNARWVWLGAWLSFASSILSTDVRNTLEFKTGSYVFLAFFLLTVVTGWAQRIAALPQQPSRLELALWGITAVTCVHAAEVAHFAVLFLALGLVIRRRLPWLGFVAIAVWPLGYWGANMLFFPRPLGLFTATGGGAVLTALREMWRTASGPLRWTSLLASGLAFSALAASPWAKQSPDRLRMHVLSTLQAIGFLVSAAGLLFLTQMNSPGYLSQRHFSYIGLCLIACAILASAAIYRLLAFPASRAALAVILLAYGIMQTRIQLPLFLAYAEARRGELTQTFALAQHVRARVAEMRRNGEPGELFVFVTRWPMTSERGSLIGSTFLGASWSRRAFAAVFSCPGEVDCPQVTYSMNTAWVRNSLAADEQLALCRRITGGTALLITDEPSGLVPRRVETRGMPLAKCIQWLEAEKLVDDAPAPLAPKG